MKRDLIKTLLLVGLIFILAACGGSRSQEAIKEPKAITVDFKLGNALVFDLDTMNVPTGAEVTINLDNSASALEHSWVLLPNETDINASPDELEANAIDKALVSVPAGEKGALTFTAPAAGAYQFVCTIPGHIQGGMKGTMTVTE